MLRLLARRLSTNPQELHWHEKPVTKEISSHIAQHSLMNLKESFEKLPSKISSGILPHVPEPDDVNYQQWLERFTEAAEAIGQAAKGQK